LDRKRKAWASARGGKSRGGSTSSDFKQSKRFL
jgi:hypothetical protein